MSALIYATASLLLNALSLVLLLVGIVQHDSFWLCLSISAYMSADWYERKVKP